MLDTITPKEALELFPMPSFRKYQKEVVEKIAEAFNSGYRVIALEAPTGFGKSAVNTAFARASESSFYITPQKSLIEQILADPYIGKYYVEIKGRQNYRCTYDWNATVDVGKCVRDKSFICDRFRVCPYWIQKLKAKKAKNVLTDFAYFVLEGQTEGSLSLGNRELLILDESHSIDRHMINYISLEVSPYTLGEDIFKTVKYAMPTEIDIDSVEEVVKLSYEMARKYLSIVQTTLEDGKTIDLREARLYRRIEDFVRKAEIFLTSDDKEWVVEEKWTTIEGKRVRYLVIKPVYARGFMYDMVWRRAKFYIISTATILDIRLFMRETGLNYLGARVFFLRVPSTFPAENRPIIDATVGKLTMDQRVQNIGRAVAKIEKILEMEPGNVAVHCHSYELAYAVEKLLAKKFKKRVLVHNSENRDDVLRIWKSSRGKVLLSVRFEEGQDWKGDICRAQILLKVPYPDSQNDARVKRRLERKEWVWYKLEALKLAIQAYGRAVRDERDFARFYVIDESFVHLIEWAWNWLPEWFKEALPPHWNKDKIRLKVAELKKIRKETKRYRGWTDSMLKQEARRLLEEEAKRIGLKI